MYLLEDQGHDLNSSVLVYFTACCLILLFSTQVVNEYASALQNMLWYKRFIGPGSQ